MKPFLGIDLTTNKKNETLNGGDFLVLEPSSAITQSYERSFEKAEETIEQSQLPLPIRILQTICGMIAVVVFVGLLRGIGGEDGVSLQQAYQNAAWLFWLGGVCLVIWAVLKIMSIRKSKTVLESEDNSRVFTNLEGVCDAIYAELAVPADAKEVDILSFFYKIKDGEVKVCEKGMQLAPYLNPIFKIFADAENLYIASLDGKYAIPLSALESIETVKKSIRIAGWNKDEDMKSGIYKEYKLSSDDYDCVHCKCYHILRIVFNGELWGLYFPCYELPAFEAVTGLQAQE